jgi:hypothetical protein
VWIDELCADRSLAAVEQLVHLPFTLCRSRKLLLLCGPELPYDLWCAFELYAWSLTGGSAEDVEVLHLGLEPSDKAEAIASFDVFHAKYARPSCRPDVQALLEETVQLAGILSFNEVVRSYLPAVQAGRVAGSAATVDRGESERSAGEPRA